MQTDLHEMSLGNIGSGAAIELFDEELKKVLANIGDPNTPAKEGRTVTLKVTIKPNEERNAASVEISALSKLAAYKPYDTYVFMGDDGSGKIRAYENNPKQPELPGLDKKIINMGGQND